jgi:protein TonB
MRVFKLLFSVLFLFSVVTIKGNAQNIEICKDPDVMAEYPGGNDALRKFISDNVKYPDECKKNNVQGKVFVSYIIDENGNVTKAKVERGVDSSLDKEALRVVKAMGKWKPGTKDGKPVKVQFTMPINFALQ